MKTNNLLTLKFLQSPTKLVLVGLTLLLLTFSANSIISGSLFERGPAVVIAESDNDGGQGSVDSGNGGDGGCCDNSNSSNVDNNPSSDNGSNQNDSNDNNTCNGDCTPQETPTPTDGPSITPSDTPTPSPTVAVCYQNCSADESKVVCGNDPTSEPPVKMKCYQVSGGSSIPRFPTGMTDSISDESEFLQQIVCSKC